MVNDTELKEKAKELFVNNSFSVETILAMLPEISKKTFSNWCTEEDWETERRSRVVHKVGRRERIESAIDRILDELDIRTDPKLIFSLGRLSSWMLSTRQLRKMPKPHPGQNGVWELKFLSGKDTFGFSH